MLSLFTITVPFAGEVTTLGVVAPLRVSFGNTAIFTGVFTAVDALSSTATGNTVGVTVVGDTVIVTTPVTQLVGVAVVHT